MFGCVVFDWFCRKATEVEVSGLSKGLDEVEGRKKELEEFNTERAHKVTNLYGSSIRRRRREGVTCRL